MIKSIALLLPIYVTLMWALVFLFQKKSPGKPNKLLGIFMLMASLLYSSHAVYFHELYHLYSFIDSLYLMILLMLCPLFYAYILLLSAKKINTSRYLLHFLPALFVGIVSLALNLALDPEQRVVYVKHILIEHNLKNLDLSLITGLKGLIFLFARVYFILQVIFYLAIGIRIAESHNKRIRDFYSETEGRRMNWVRDVSIIIFVVSAMGIVFSLIGRSYFTRHELSLLVPSLTFSTIYFLIGFNGNQQLMIADELAEPINGTNHVVDDMGNKQEKQLKEKLLALFEKEKIHRLSDLRITTVSEALQTNRTYISRLINDEFGVNFNEFVNRYRVEEAEQLMRNSEHKAYTLDYIAEQSGFGSTNSFTRAFKELKGVTPGTFRERL